MIKVGQIELTNAPFRARDGLKCHAGIFGLTRLRENGSRFAVDCLQPLPEVFGLVLFGYPLRLNQSRRDMVAPVAKQRGCACSGVLR